MKKMFNEGNQIHNLISSSGSGTVINYGSGSDLLTSYGSGSTTLPRPTGQEQVLQNLYYCIYYVSDTVRSGSDF
jgi:hypothetical protein